MFPLKLVAGSGRTLAAGGQQVRTLRIYLAATTFLYFAGVAFTLFPVSHDVKLSDPTGGIIAVVLGVAALIHLAIRPQRPGPATAAAIIATPTVMAFHQLMNAQFACLVAAMFLAMYLRAFHSPRQAWILVLTLTTACVAALGVAPSPKLVITYLIVAIGIVGAAESFGGIARGLVAAACTDPLTGLLNRAGWEIATDALLARRRHADAVVSVIALDLDGLKELNDTFGHQRGDQHLIDHARVWADAAPDGAALARFGGDEFVVCMVSRDPGVGERFVAEIARLTPDVSAGLATAPMATADITALYAAADVELCEVKGRTLRHR
jgi:diguanylate cyclase (GGDEF)-like protein